jgi:hypothetical protein
VNSANGLIRPSDKAALADLIGTIDSSLRNHDGGRAAHQRGQSGARWHLVDKE